MPRRDDIHSILIIGSGPIVIGQACEFDYSGTQACRVLREEGYRVILANSNPATIMTDPDFADATYIEPLTWEVVSAIIDREQPDAVLPDARRPDRAEHRHGAVRAWPDRRAGQARDDRRQRRGDRHRRGPRELQAGDGRDRPRLPALGDGPHDGRGPHGRSPTSVCPRSIRPAYILGGRGTGIASHAEEFEQIAANGLEASPISEILIEESMSAGRSTSSR